MTDGLIDRYVGYIVDIDGNYVELSEEENLEDAIEVARRRYNANPRHWQKFGAVCMRDIEIVRSEYT